ncbi:MAG: TrmH family RNA methyltransferase [Verrucomicrobiota bacterium]
MTRHETLLAWVNESGAGHFVIEGRWCIEALLGNPRFEVEGIVRAAGSHGDFVAGEVPVHEVPKSELSAAAGYTFHRGLIAVAKRPVDDVVPDGRLLVACPELADSANLGAIIRSAAALGASGILLPKSRGADVYSRKAIRASSGAVFRLPVHQSDDLFQRISDLRAVGNWLRIETHRPPGQRTACSANELCCEE